MSWQARVIAALAFALALAAGARYDFRGAVGLSLEPFRVWSSDEKWFCHEMSAAFLHACGRKIFAIFGHVTDSSLLLVNPAMSTYRIDGELVAFSRSENRQREI